MSSIYNERIDATDRRRFSFATTIREHPLHKYGEDILITIPYVVCLKGIGYKIINKSWYENTQKLPEKEEKRVLVEAAAAVIVEDIRSQVYNLTEYPSP